MISEVEKTYLLISNTHIITKEELQDKEKLSKELESLNNKMKEKEFKIKNSN
jgi:hypothetical protein